jgi:hypothetical protein
MLLEPAKDHEIVERALPAHLLYLVAETLRNRREYDLRADVLHYLNLASAAPFVGLDEFSTHRLARRIDAVAAAVLCRLRHSDLRGGLLTLAHLVLQMVDEGLYPDPDDQAVKVALLIAADARENPEWAASECAARAAAGDLLHQLNLHGLFLHLSKAA